MKQIVKVPGVSRFFPYPPAVKYQGLVFVSGIRPDLKGKSAGFAGLPASCRAKEQGFGVVDTYEAQVSVDSLGAHANLDAVLMAAGSGPDQILRQHIWQRDKRFFPCYEEIRRQVQKTPSPSSGLGVSNVVGNRGDWIGIDAIGVAPKDNPAFGDRTVLSAVDNRNLPSASHYSQAVQTGDFVFTAGHIAIKTSEPGKPLVNSFDDVPQEGRFLATGRSHPDSRDGPIAAQTWYIYNELAKLLVAGGLTLNDTILSTVYLSDIRDFAVFHRLHTHFFPKNGPALCVSGFDEVGHRGCRIEIELTAVSQKSKMKSSSVAWSISAPFAAPAARVVGNFCFYSGMLGIDADGRLVGSSESFSGETRAILRQLEQGETKRGFAAQSWACLDRLSEAAKSAGSGIDDLLKMTVYLSDPRDLPIFDEVRAQFISENALPAFECVSILGPGPVPEAVVQIEAIGAI
jgi:enamine deaminase RidA (YjgF/YER057c/UK114 family)